MEYRYTPTPAKEEEKVGFTSQMRDFLDFDNLDAEDSELLKSYVADILFETRSILGINGYSLSISSSKNTETGLASRSSADVNMVYDKDIKMFLPQLRINPGYIEETFRKKPAWKYKIAQCLAHESHHLRQFQIAPSLQSIDPLYGRERDENTATDLWNRFIPEFAAELFALNYLKAKFDGTDDRMFYAQCRSLEKRIQRMKDAILSRGRSHGIKDEVKAGLIRKYNVIYLQNSEQPPESPAI
jgi:hypothetical protein